MNWSELDEKLFSELKARRAEFNTEKKKQILDAIAALDPFQREDVLEDIHETYNIQSRFSFNQS